MSSIPSIRRLRRGTLALAACLSLAGLAPAQIHTFGVCFDGNQSGTGSPGTGFATVVVNEGTNEVSVSGTYTGLNGSQTTAHIHGPAAIGGSAGIVLTLNGTGGTTGTVTGAGVLTATEVQDLLALRHYINIHSTTNMAGEIRGHIVQRVNADCPPELVTDPLLADNAGNTTLGPKIGSTTERFNVSLDCSGSNGPDLYVIQLQRDKLTVPTATSFGHIWVSGPVHFRCIGGHTQNVVTCRPVPGIVLPNDITLVGRAYTMQGWCGDPGLDGRMSNAITQVIGL